MQLRQRDKVLEEDSVKLEFLEARAKEAKEKASRVGELERSVDDLRKQQKLALEHADKQSRDLERLRQERDKWRGQAEEARRLDEEAEEKGKGERLVGTKREIDNLRGDIRVLEEANRYLRKAARKDFFEKQQVRDQWLSKPIPKPKPVTPLQSTKEWDALDRLMRLPTNAQMVKLDGMTAKEGRLRWRPEKETPKYQLSKIEFDRMEAWRPWEEGLSRGGNVVGAV